MSRARPRIVLFGARGQLGADLRPLLAPLGELFAVTGPSAPPATGAIPVDLERPGAAGDLVARIRPDLVVNAAAYTAVDRAEDEPERARRVNAEAPAEMARALAAAGGTLVHVSTDFVFPGTGRRPLTEDDPVAPVNVYGETKLEGERAVLDAGIPAFVLRTAWLYSGHGRSFLSAILARYRRGERLRVVDDRTGSPTWTRELAAAIVAIAVRSLAGGEEWARCHAGLYHASASGACTWYELARSALELWGHGAAPPRLEPIPGERYPTPAPRPGYTALDGERLRSCLGLALRPWPEGLRDLARECTGADRLPGAAADR